MSKRELNIPINIPLTSDTEEDILFKSPARIPDKGLQSLIELKKIRGLNVSYYDIALTENLAVKRLDDPPFTPFEGDTYYFLSAVDLTMIMGENFIE